MASASLSDLQILDSLITSIQLGSKDTIIYIGMNRIWPKGYLTNFVTEDDIQFITEQTEQRLYYDTIMSISE